MHKRRADRYDTLGIGYARTRREDPRLASRIHAALGDARTVVNVGAGTGSYEPRDRAVVAVEPSDVMIAQRPRDVPRRRARAYALLSAKMTACPSVWKGSPSKLTPASGGTS